MFTKTFSKRILVGITGKTEQDWRSKLKEVEKYNIKKIALFLEQYGPQQRQKIYAALLNSKIRRIPFVHARDDMEKEEFLFLKKRFKTRYFNIHKGSFKNLKKWEGIHRYLFLEFGIRDSNKIPKNVDVSKIGGFCIDLSHFKAEEERWTKAFEYVIERKKVHHYFKCNHLNGYSFKRRKDKHTVQSRRDFDYLHTLPKFVFGDIIALEMYNPIKQQLRYRDYLIKLLNHKFTI